jgi:hypothetical protein
MLGSLLNKTRAWSADALKAIGLPPSATAEDLANIQEQVRVNMELIKQNSVFRDAEGNVEADLSGALTGGNNLGASLDAIEKQVDRMQGVYAAPPPVVGGKAPPTAKAPHPDAVARATEIKSAATTLLQGGKTPTQVANQLALQFKLGPKDRKRLLDNLTRAKAVPNGP